MVKLFTFVSLLASLMLTASCAKPFDCESTLQHAAALLETHPDSAMQLLRGIDERQLLRRDWYDFAILQVKVALVTDATPDAALIHQAALRQQRMDKSMEAAECFYYAAMAYEAIHSHDEAVADCLKGIDCFDLDEQNAIKSQLYDLLRRLVTNHSDTDWVNMQHQVLSDRQSDGTIHSFLLAMSVALVSAAYASIKERRNQQEIARLNTQLQSLQTDNPAGTQTGLDQATLSLHHQIFQRSEAYADLLQLKYMRDQVVSIQNRTRLMREVAAAYNSEVLVLRSLNEMLSDEDLFLCLMSYMRFSTHDVASCLGVTDEAVRKRRSRLRQKLDEETKSIFFA